MDGLRILGGAESEINFGGYVDEIELKLFVWVDQNGKYRHAYSPTDRPVFFPSKQVAGSPPPPTPKLRIKLIEKDQTARFEFLTFYQSGAKKAVKSVAGKARGKSNADPHVRPAKPPIFDGTTTSIEFELDLPSPDPEDQEDSYIAILVIDTEHGQIVPCDPQVENGTGGHTLVINIPPGII